MKVTVVTPVYNEPRVRDALDSLLSQRDVPELEVIVIEGDSTDETPEILESYADRIDTLVREPDEGIYDAMNKGIRRASGDVVGILNADDRYQHPAVLRTVLDTFEKRNVELCYGDLVYVDDDDEVVRYWKSGEYRPRRFYLGWMPPHPTVFVKRDVYDRYDLFDLDFPIAADYELLLRLLLVHGLSAAYIEEVLVRMSTGGQSNASVSNIVRANLEVYRAWRKNQLRWGIHVPFLKPLRKVPQYFLSFED